MTPEERAEWPEGRLDVNGQRWFACDPYPTWFRVDDQGIVQRNNGHYWETSYRYEDAYPWVDEYDFENLVDDRVYLKVKSDRYCAVHVEIGSGHRWDNGAGACGYSKKDHVAHGGWKDHEFVPDTEIVLAPRGMYRLVRQDDQY